jgi:hypothetical protein
MGCHPDKAHSVRQFKYTFQVRPASISDVGLAVQRVNREPFLKAIPDLHSDLGKMIQRPLNDGGVSAPRAKEYLHTVI